MKQLLMIHPIHNQHLESYTGVLTTAHYVTKRGEWVDCAFYEQIGHIQSVTKTSGDNFRGKQYQTGEFGDNFSYDS